MKDNFESQLSGGHPNSLGNTETVVNEILADPSKIQALYNTYSSSDEVVRLRVSSAFKRICRVRPDLLESYIDKFIKEVSLINQPSALWTLAQLFEMLEAFMSEDQKRQAEGVMKRNLEESNDWIVKNISMEVLGKWSLDNTELRLWLLPRLRSISNDPRKSVSKKALKTIQIIS